jgi:hypothetical protein
MLSKVTALLSRRHFQPGFDRRLGIGLGNGRLGSADS